MVLVAQPGFGGYDEAIFSDARSIIGIGCGTGYVLSMLTKILPQAQNRERDLFGWSGLCQEEAARADRGFANGCARHPVPRGIQFDCGV